MRINTIFFILPLLVSCHLGQSKYSYIEIVESPTEGIIEREPEIFYEKNDSSAYDWALDRFSVSEGIYKSMDGKAVQEAARVPLTFVVVDKNERRVYRGDNNVAFKSARFGMNRQQVHSLELLDFDDSHVSIADNPFKVEFAYGDKEYLYWVQLTSEMFDWTQYYDVVRPLAESLLPFFKKDYGMPTFVNKLPSRNQVDRAEKVIPLYIWDMPQKYIVVAFSSDARNGLSDFFIDTRIIEKKTWYSLFNNDKEAAEDAYWSKMGYFAASYYKLQIEMKKIDGDW